MKRILTIVFMCLVEIGCSQSIDGVDLDYRLFAENILANKLLNYTRNTNHIFFTSGKEFTIVLVERDSMIQEIYLHNDDSLGVNIYSDSTFVLKRDLFNKMFDVSRYRDDFVSFASKFYNNGYDVAKGNMTYFVYFTKDGKRYGESRLSMFVNPNPIDFEVYQYCVERVMYYASKKYIPHHQ